MKWTDLTPDQQCVLLNAVEESYLFGMLQECGGGWDWQERLTHVPRLTRIVEELIDQGLVELTKDPEEEGVPPVSVPGEQVHAILADPGNWWSADGVRPFSLAPTDAGLAVYESTPARDAEKR